MSSADEAPKPAARPPAGADLALREPPPEGDGGELRQLTSQLGEIARHLARREAEAGVTSAELQQLRLHLAKREAELDAKDTLLAESAAAANAVRKQLEAELKGRLGLQAALE